MLKASDLFNDEQKIQVEKSVTEAEANTSCEIVPVVATISGRYDRPEDIIGLWFAGLSTVALWLLIPRNNGEVGDWGAVPVSMEIFILVATIVIMFMLGVLLGSQIGSLKRLFTPRKQMQEEVALKAREIFFDKRIHHTTGGTGILIYVSVFEHIAMVLGDQEILNHPQLGQAFLDDLCKRLTETLHQGHPAEAICETIIIAGEKLSGPLPRAQDDVNELHDALVLID